MNDLKAKKNKKVIARMQLHAKLRNKSNPKKKSTPLTHVRTKPVKSERIKARKDRQLKNRLARGTKVMSMLQELKNDIVDQIKK